MQFVALLIFIFLLPVGICSQPREIIFDGTGSLTRDIVKAKLAAENLQLNEEWSATIRGYTMIGTEAFSQLGYIGNKVDTNKIVLSLVSVIIENGCETIGMSAFENIPLLSTINIKSNLETIYDRAFRECIYLENMVLPETVDTIGSNAFENCKKIKFAKLPDKLTTLGAAAFLNCPNILISEIPVGVKTISTGCFQACDGINKMKLHKDINEIGLRAFYKCANLKTVVCLAVTPPKIRQMAFSLGYTQKIVYVPSESISLYRKDATGWGYGNFCGIIDTNHIQPLVEIVVSSNNEASGTATPKGSNIVMGDTLELIATPNSTNCSRFVCWKNMNTGEIISQYKRLVIKEATVSAKITAIFE